MVCCQSAADARAVESGVRRRRGCGLCAPSHLADDVFGHGEGDACDPVVAHVDLIGRTVRPPIVNSTRLGLSSNGCQRRGTEPARSSFKKSQGARPTSRRDIPRKISPGQIRAVDFPHPSLTATRRAGATPALRPARGRQAASAWGVGAGANAPRRADGDAAKTPRAQRATGPGRSGSAHAGTLGTYPPRRRFGAAAGGRPALPVHGMAVGKLDIRSKMGCARGPRAGLGGAPIPSCPSLPFMPSEQIGGTKFSARC